MPNIERLKQARSTLSNIPEQSVALGIWMNECQTLACGIGHLLLAKTDPQIAKVETTQIGCTEVYMKASMEPITPSDWGRQFFNLGDDEFWMLFGNATPEERVVQGSEDRLSDKQVLLKRLEDFLVNS